MAVPKRKTCQSRQGIRRSHLALKPVHLGKCSQCKNPLRPHRICSNCGYYGDESVIPVED